MTHPETTAESLNETATKSGHSAWQHSVHYWRNYLPADLQKRADALRQSRWITSLGLPLHVDVYPQTNLDAPVVVFFHGGGGYARLFAGLASAFHQQGFHVVMPDLIGQGFSAGDRSDFLFSQFIENGLDTVSWAKMEFTGPMILSGGSMGSMLAYGTQAALIAQQQEPAQAVLTSNLYNPADINQMLGMTRLNPLLPLGLGNTFKNALGFLVKRVPNLRLPYQPLAKFSAMVDDPSGHFFHHYRGDPNPIRRVSIRYLHSLLNYHYPVEFNQNRYPVWVINPVRDKMTSPSLTQQCFNQLAGPKKLIEWPCGHFALDNHYNKNFAELLRQCLEQTDPATSPPRTAQAPKKST